MNSRIIALALSVATAFCLALCGCGGQGASGQAPQEQGPPALSKAYEALQDAGFPDGALKATYDEGTDELSLVLGGNESRVDEVFDVLDEAVSGKSIGTLSVYIESGWVEGVTPSEKTKHAAAMMPVLSKRIGELPCVSMECLGIGRFVRDMSESELVDGSWTEILPKTTALRLGFWGGTYAFTSYPQEERDNLAHITCLELGNRYLGGNFSILPNIEEVVFLSGDDADEKEDTARIGLTWKSNMRDHMVDLAGLGSLQRMIFFPDLEEWKTSDDYYEFVMAVQASCPEAMTNEPGVGWDGDGEALIPITDIDIRKAVGDEKFERARSDLLRVAAKASFEKGQDFPLQPGTPKLDGPTLVYRMSNPYKLEWSDYGQFSSGGKVLLSEFDGTGVLMPTDSFQHDYLVYAYPTYTLVGHYTSGTEAYSTTVNVQVYDMVNKVKYEPVVVDEIQPSETRIWDSDEKEAPEPNDASIASYVAGLA